MDQNKLNQFTQAALQSGYSMSEISQFIKLQQGVSGTGATETKKALDIETKKLEIKSKKLDIEKKEKEKGIDKEKEKKKQIADKATNIYKYVEDESEGLAFGDKLGPNLLSALPIIGQRINPKANTWEMQRPALAIQIATQVFGAEKRVSEKEREAYLSRLPSIYDTEKTRKEKLRKLREQINNDLRSQGSPPLKEERKKSLEDIFR